MFRAIADDTRRQLLDLLVSTDRTASELARPFRMTPAAISQHLRLLREAGLVMVLREGRHWVYHLTPAPLDAIYAWATPYHLLVDTAQHMWHMSGSLPPAKETS